MNACQYVIRAETPKFIPVADQPLRQGGKVEYLAVEEFQKRLGCTYSEGVSLGASTQITPFREDITSELTSTQLKQQVEKVLKSTYDHLVLCNMGELGYGVFTSKDIPKYSVVAIYSGTLMQGSKVSNAQDHAKGYYGTNMSFSTLQHRGIASFMQHLPEQPKCESAKAFCQVLKMHGQNVSEEQLKLNVELYSTKFTPAFARNFVAIENIKCEFLNFNTVPVIAMLTNRAVKAGEQLGFNYGYSYWLSRKITPELFDSNGAKLSWNLYKRTFGQLNFGSFSYTGEFQPLIDALKKKEGTVSLKDDEKKVRNVRSSELTVLLLKANAASLSVDPVFNS